MIQNAILITLLPLLAFIVIVFITKKAKKLSAYIALLSVGGSLGLSIIIFMQTVLTPKTTQAEIEWLNIPSIGNIKGLNIKMGILIDPLSTIMLIIVTFIATMVILYSMGYMKDDGGYSRYFAYISLFTFSMLGLVVASNYFQVFVFWELVGLCSYLLIGFWFEKPAAADASRKAFITNRWADFGLMTGIILLFVHFGTFNFSELSGMIQNSKDIGFLTLAGVLVFIGPLGKSAQFPLHVWLPDAMEGPTPVSALIHAATMVAAGVYLIARGYILFASVPSVLTVMAYVGGFTAIFAASIAIVQRDIKRILAYSTLSQLGYMIMALGVGSVSAGMFHLTTHAFFKALLFLGAGSVIHAVHEQDIFKMGNLKKKMPITTWTFVIGALALSGIFPLAGFWSKDEILSAALSHNYTLLYIIGLIVAFMTPLYMFRLIFVAFFDKSNKCKHEPHESEWTMTIPLILLAILAVVAGLVNSPWFYNYFGKSFSTFIFFKEPEIPYVNMTVAAISTVLAIAGILTSWLVYNRKIINTESLAKKHNGLYNLVYNKYYIDELYGWIFANLFTLTGNALNWVDHNIVDGVFDNFARLINKTAKKLRLTQTGYLQSYALVIFAAVVIMVIAMATPILGGVIK